MAADQDQERTHAATPRRIEQAREEGQVARSRELTSALLLLGASGASLAAGPAIAGWFGSLLRRGLEIDRATAFEPATALARAGALALESVSLLLPVLALLAALAFFAPLALGGWLFVTQPMEPDLNRLSPLRWAKQTFSVQGLTELGKAIGKALVIGSAALGVIWLLRADLASLLSIGAYDAIGHTGYLGALGFLAAALAMLAIAALDVPAQIWHHRRWLRMSNEELRRDTKETEGDPHLKQRIRTQQRERARRRMMQSVPRADVVVTNPTHYAVALSWKESSMGAPRVVAKGAELVAARIRELAAEHGVPVVEAPPLARALHRHAEIGDEIPAALYGAVAQVLAWSYALRAGRAAGDPGEIAVPEDMDPLAGGNST